VQYKRVMPQFDSVLVCTFITDV